ncbi:MAG: zinc-dependent metalloprotease [Polyangiales bacterium]
MGEAFRGRPIGEASIRTQQLYTRMVMHHEMGHSVGLRHNFAASFDRNNYGDGYFNAVFDKGLRLPLSSEFDTNNDGFLGGSEYDKYIRRLREVRDERAKIGAHNFMSSSTMDYSGDTADAQGLGHYDAAATIWNYFDMEEAYDLRGTSLDTTDIRTDANGPYQGLVRSNQIPRTYFSSYLGGERCSVEYDPVTQTKSDVGCPYAQGSSSLSSTQPVYQRCVQNPRKVSPQVGCDVGQTDCVCSNFEQDMYDYMDFAGYVNAGDNTQQPRQLMPVDYLFCTDDRVSDISWCNRNDAGESFREVIDHFRRSWEDSYPERYFRRFQAAGARSGGTVGYVIDAAKIYQHLFWRYNNESGFRNNAGPLGFEDQFQASVDAMNWFIEILNLPEPGSYRLDAADNVYRFMGSDMDQAGSDISIRPGQGFSMWSKYQDGYWGFFRAERAGIFTDKRFALAALTLRDWGLSYNIDERYFINFNDLFPVEMSELFGGLVMDNPRWFAPRIASDNQGAPLMVDGDPISNT